MNERNRFAPPSADVHDVRRATTNRATWVARIVGIVCVAGGALQMTVLSMVIARGGLGLGAIYLVSVGPLLWCFAGYLVYKRSKRALIFCFLAIVVPTFSGPWIMHVLSERLGANGAYFSYWNALALKVRATTAADAIFYTVVLGFAAWDYQRRFGKASHEL